MHKTFTKDQAETVFTLLLNRKTEKQISKATKLSMRMVRQIIVLNRRGFAERLYQHRKALQVRRAQSAEANQQVAQCENMVDAMREVLGKDPLYAVDEHTCGAHPTKVEIAEARTKQAKRIKINTRSATKMQPNELNLLEELFEMTGT